MSTLGKLRRLNKYCFKGHYDNYLYEFAVEISAHMNSILFTSNQENIENAINANRIVDVECGRLYVNSNNKTFIWYGGIDYTEKLVNFFKTGKAYPEDISNSLSVGIFPSELYEFYETPKIKICPFGYITKVEFIDRTTVDENRTYTLESNMGSTMLGAIVGSMFDTTVFDNNAITGAMIGASGARRITEKVEKTVNTAFDVILYFNDINNLSQTIRFYNEQELREFIAVREFIINNKEGSGIEVKEIELNKNDFKVDSIKVVKQYNYIDKGTYIILAILLGYLGAHQFYAKQNRKGLVYLLFSWSLIPWIFAIIDAIKMFLKPTNEFGKVQLH